MRKASSVASLDCAFPTCASRQTSISSSTRAWRTAFESVSSSRKPSKGSQTPGADLTPPRPEVAELAPRIWEVIEKSRVLTAVTHKDADGDTLGSAVALAPGPEPVGETGPGLSVPPLPGA